MLEIIIIIIINDPDLEGSESVSDSVGETAAAFQANYIVLNKLKTPMASNAHNYKVL